MDRRAEGQARPRMVAPEIHGSWGREHLVEDKLREGGGAHRGWQDESARPRGSRARETGWALGGSLCFTEPGDGAARPGEGVGGQPPRGAVLRDARVAQPLRHPVPRPYGEEARDAGSSHRKVRRDAGEAREAAPSKG